MTNYFGVISNRDVIKYQGEKRPFWDFLERLPDGWLTSLAYTNGVIDAPRSKYYAVINRPDSLKLRGKRVFFGEFLEQQPSGWLSSLAYKRSVMPAEIIHMIWDCGAWSYKTEEIPKLGKNLVTPEWAAGEYTRLGQEGDFVIAPDHMLIPWDGVNLDARRKFNRDSAYKFLEIIPNHLRPMATIHGIDLDERLEYGHYLVNLGYQILAIGGLAGQASRKTMILEVVKTIREEFPDIWLHVLGLSAPSYAAEWARLGVDSFDGASHFKQAFTAGKYYTEQDGELKSYQAARPGEEITAPKCACLACSILRTENIDTRTYGSNEHNMGRAAHNLNMLMRAHQKVMAPTIILVSCVGEKANQPMPACELYQSSWFLKAKRYAQKKGQKWYILSAKYGVILPDTIIEPYEKTLNAMPANERKAWGVMVMEQLNKVLPKRARIEILAGSRYREYLEDELELGGFSVKVPMRGLGIGQQLAWLDHQMIQSYKQLSFLGE